MNSSLGSTISNSERSKLWRKKTKEKPQEPTEQQPPWYLGVTSVLVGVTLTHPLGLIYINKQGNATKYVSVLQVLDKMRRYRGLQGFYFGFSSSILRHFIQSSSWYLSFNSIIRNFHVPECNTCAGIVAAGFSGIFSSIISMPLTKAAIVTQADLMRDFAHRRNYIRATRAIKYMHKEGGFRYLYQGWEVNSLHCSIVSVGQLPTYDILKRLITEKQIFDSAWKVYLMASTLAGNILAVFLIPISVVRNVIMNASHGEYKSTWEACKNLKRVHGFGGFIIGYRAALLRIIITTFIVSWTYDFLISKLMKLCEVQEEENYSPDER